MLSGLTTKKNNSIDILCAHGLISNSNKISGFGINLCLRCSLDKISTSSAPNLEGLGYLAST